jgi:hypothetical protein
MGVTDGQNVSARIEKAPLLHDHAESQHGPRC